MSLQKKILNGFNIYYYDSEWQKPVITEENVFKLFMKNENLPNNYIAFPWANMIDRIKTPNYLYDKIKDFKIDDLSCFTVVQHISFRKFLELFSGVIDILSLERPISASEIMKLYQKGSVLLARIIYVDHGNKKVRLYLRPHIVEFRAPSRI
jgi:hypothetical protein